jgi:hypothetical protein
MCGGCAVAAAFFRDPSMRFRCSIELHPAIHCSHAKPFAVFGPFAIRGLPFFPREGSQRGSRHRAGTAGHAFRHMPRFAIREDASVRDDWIVEPNNPYCFKISTSRRALGPRRERTREGEDMALKLLSHSGTKSGLNDQHSPLAGHAALVGFVGTMLQHYDFMIYGAAAVLIFPKVFVVNLTRQPQPCYLS